jgi:ketosteroid isomerase-like protein
MAQDNVDVIQGAWDAFRRGDIEAATAVADPSAEFVAPDSLPWGGSYHGPEGARELFTTFLSHFDKFEAKPEKVLGADDDHVVVLVHVAGRTKSGQDLDSDAVWLYKMRNGQVIRADLFVDTARTLEAIG